MIRTQTVIEIFDIFASCFITTLFYIWYLRLAAVDHSLVEPWMASSCCLRFVSAQGDWERSYLIGLWKCLWITPRIRYQYNLNKAVFYIYSSLIVTDRPHQGWAGSDRVQTRGGQVWGRVRRRRVLWNCSWWGEEEEAGTEEESWMGLPLVTLGEQRERDIESFYMPQQSLLSPRDGATI